MKSLPRCGGERTVEESSSQDGSCFWRHFRSIEILGKLRLDFNHIYIRIRASWPFTTMSLSAMIWKAGRQPLWLFGRSKLWQKPTALISVNRGIQQLTVASFGRANVHSFRVCTRHSVTVTLLGFLKWMKFNQEH